MKKLLASLLLLAAMVAFPGTMAAQFRVGVSGGVSYNRYSMDKQYMTDYRFYGGWGATAGIMGQYNFTDWFGIRAELDWAQRNYRHTRAVYEDKLDYRYNNQYLLVPVMANFSFGGRLRGFVNVGCYGGYWLSSRRSGKEYNFVSHTSFNFSQTIKFNPEKDQRADFGLTGGLGMEFLISAHWAVQTEVRGYYSVVSSVKQYMAHVQDYRYNTTVGIQLGGVYTF